MNKKSITYRMFCVFNCILMIVLAAIFLFPYLTELAKALNDSADTAIGGLTIYPRKPTLENFKTILGDPNILLGFRVSVLRVIFGTLVALLVQFAAAYAMTKKDLIGKNAILIFMTIPMFITGGLIPQYILYSRLNLLNNFLVYILPGAFSFYNMVVMRTYIDSIPDSLFESARLDGAGEARILAQIVIPLSAPVIATVALWLMVGYWNDWTTTLYFVTKRKLYTIQYMLMQVINENQRVQAAIEEALKKGMSTNIKVKTTSASLKSAQIIVTTIPILCIYPFLQKYFVKGIMVGSVKG